MEVARVQAPAKAPYSNDGFDCAICWESFNNEQHCPYSLWCGHTLCKECVHSLPWAKISTFSVPVQLPCVIACPWCTWLTPRLVCTGGLRYPCKNYSLLWLVETIPRARSPSLTPTDSPPLLRMSPFRPPLPPTPAATAPLPASQSRVHSLSNSPLVPAFRSAWRAGGSVATQRPPPLSNPSTPSPSSRPPPSSHPLPSSRPDPHPDHPPSFARVVEPVAAAGRAVAAAAVGGGGGGAAQMGLGFELFLGFLVLLLTCASLAVRTIRKLPLVLMLSFIVLFVLPISGAVTAVHFLLSFFFAIPSSAIMVLCIYYAEWLVLRIMD